MHATRRRKERKTKKIFQEQVSKWSIVMLCSTYLQSVFIIAERLKIKFILNTETIVKRQRKKISCRQIKYLFIACFMYLSLFVRNWSYYPPSVYTLFERIVRRNAKYSDLHNNVQLYFNFYFKLILKVSLQTNQKSLRANK